MKRSRRQRGFTLIEILAVLALIAILGLVALPQVASYIKKGKVEACRTNLRELETAWAAAQASDSALGAVSSDDLDELASYLNSTPACPLGGDYSVDDKGIAHCSIHKPEGTNVFDENAEPAG